MWNILLQIANTHIERYAHTLEKEDRIKGNKIFEEAVTTVP